MKHAYDLTEGKVSNRLLAFYFPMLFTGLLQQIYSVADTAIVGKGLGDNALGAVGNLSPLSLLIIGFSMGMTNGFGVIIAQNYGADNATALRKSIALSIRLSVFLALVLTLAACLFLNPLLLLMQTDASLFSDSLCYGYIVFGGLAATIAYNLSSSILRSLGDSRTPFLAIVISSVINIVLDCVLIFLVHTDVGGAAFATVFSQTVSALLCFLKIRKMSMLPTTTADYKKDTGIFFDLLKNGIPMACMNSITAVGCMVVQGYVNGLGAAYTSAYSVCSKYLNLFMLPSITAGFSVSAFVSQNYGAKRFDRIRDGVRACSVIALISYLLCGFVMCFFPKSLAGLMLNETETIFLAVEYLKICGAMLFLVNFLFIFRNSVQGMGRPLIPMYSGIAEMVLRIPVIICLLPKIGFQATAYAEAAAWIGALAMNLTAYLILIRKESFIHGTQA